jgi:hypothetical protein
VVAESLKLAVAPDADFAASLYEDSGPFQKEKEVAVDQQPLVN